MNLEDKIKKLYDYNKRLHVFDAISALTDWDRATGGPKGGIQIKQEIFSYLSGEEYNLLTSNEFGELLKSLEMQKEELNQKDRRLFDLTKRKAEDVRSIPKNEYTEYSSFIAESQEVWEEAKENNDYLMFAPYLKKIIEYNKKFAGYRQKNNMPLYDVLLDDYEEGMTMKDYDKFFETLRKDLVPLIHKILEKGKKTPISWDGEIFDTAKQEELSEEILKIIGFNFDNGMFKASAHPFTTGFDNKDIRLTTRYDEKDLAMSLFSTMHEGGHAIYEQQIADEYRFSMLGGGVSSGIHESQSRTFENEYGKSREFLRFCLPKLKQKFEFLKDVDEEYFYRAYNQAIPSAIRIEADELTYPLHIMIRYELEKEMMNKDIDINTLNIKWREKYKEYLGIDIENDSEGILQDVHWAAGLIGYFPTYALGSAYASQFTEILKKEIDLNKLLENGEFKPILEWHKENIHSYGSLKTPKELLKDVTLEDLNPKYYVDYLINKFSKIYDL